MKLIHILSILLIIFIIIILFSKLKVYSIEGMTENEFINQEKSFYEYRKSGGLMSDLNEANDFLQYNSSKPLGSQLVKDDSMLSGSNNKIVSTTDTNVDIAVKQCSSMTSCDQLDNSPCGYCFYNNTFKYGDNNGPLTDVCPGGWVKTKSECLERRERAICDTVKNCKEMIGDASICAWCPVNNKAYVYKEEGGLLVPKYRKDECKDDDITTGKSLGLVKQSDCAKFNQNHPCIGPSEETGPHSINCLQHLWKTAGGSDLGTSAPQNNQDQTNEWNKQSWDTVFTDMKTMVKDANSNDWNQVKAHYKGVYGKDPEPCNNKYNPLPVDCYQKLFTSNGCEKGGDGYPTTTNKNYTDYTSSYSTIQKFIDFVKGLVSTSKSTTTNWDDKNNANNACYGKNLSAPLPTKPGDYVQYFFAHPKFGKSVIKGYVSSVSGGFSTVFWTDAVINNKTYNRDDTNIEEQINVLGAVAGQTPFGLEGMNVPASIPTNNLQVLTHCHDVNNCKLQHIIIIDYKGTSTYSIKKEQIIDVLNKLNDAIPNSNIATMEDIQYLVNSGVANCQYGWTQNGNDYNVTMPSNKGSNSYCGSGTVGIINNGNTAPSWASNKASLYARVYINPSILDKTLDNVGLRGKIISTVGKDHYSSTKAGSVDSSNWDINNHDMNYVGCYIDKPSRALPVSLGNNLTFEDAKDKAIKGGYKYFGLQDTGDFGNKRSQGWAGNNSDYDKYGKSDNCKMISDGKHVNYPSGSEWVNAVYSL